MGPGPTLKESPVSSCLHPLYSLGSALQAFSCLLAQKLSESAGCHQRRLCCGPERPNPQDGMLTAPWRCQTPASTLLAGVLFVTSRTGCDLPPGVRPCQVWPIPKPAKWSEVEKGSDS